MTNRKPPKIKEPSPEVRAQIYALEKDGAKSMRLDKEGRVHATDVDPIDLYVAGEGCRAASWLIFSQRDRFHRSGYIDFTIAAENQTPIWFRVAFEYLRRRSKNFFVYMNAKHGVRHYMVRWEKWNTFSPTARARALLAPPANNIS